MIISDSQINQFQFPVSDRSHALIFARYDELAIDVSGFHGDFFPADDVPELSAVMVRLFEISKWSLVHHLRRFSGGWHSRHLWPAWVMRQFSVHQIARKLDCGVWQDVDGFQVFGDLPVLGCDGVHFSRED